jgi:hypothetical protein
MILNTFFFCIFFLVTKEFVFFGEERLIVFSYLALFLGLFYLFAGSMVVDFQARVNILKKEYDSFFSSILNFLFITKKALHNFIYFNLLVKNILIALFVELNTYFSASFNFNLLHKNVRNIINSYTLNRSVELSTFFFNMFFNKVMPNVSNSIIGLKASNLSSKRG